jgi:prepilin-type N-terminal cleavage/methylation domain-containing protein
MNTNLHSPRRGFTLMELLIALAVMTILLTLAVPTFADMAARHRLAAASEMLALDLQQARFDAVQRGVPVHVNFSGGAQWCYAVSLEPGCDCNAAASSCALRRGDSTDFPGVALSAGAARVFDAARGQSSPGTAAALSAGSTLHTEVQLSVVGRASVCSRGSDMPRLARCA